MDAATLDLLRRRSLEAHASGDHDGPDGLIEPYCPRCEENGTMTDDTIRGCVHAAMCQLCEERDEPVPEVGTPSYVRLRDDLEAAYQRARKLGRWREGDDPDGILREYEEPSGPLTEDDRRWAIEAALSHVANRSVERSIRSAWEHGSRSDAADMARRLCKEWGQGGADGWVNGMTDSGRGLFVERHDDGGDRAGFVRWSEIADACAPVRQERLL